MNSGIINHENDINKLIYYNLNDNKNYIINDSSSDSSFLTFNSLDDILVLVYSSENNSIVLYNIIDNKKINIIKNAHNKEISFFRHGIDNKNLRDLILSLSCYDANIKLWDFNNMECLINIYEKYRPKFPLVACIMNDNYQTYVINNYCRWINNKINIFSLSGEKLKMIDLKEYTIYNLDNYTDNILNKNYIIIIFDTKIISYDCDKNEKYKEYINISHYNFDFEYLLNLVVKNINNITNLFFSDNKEIKVWNFNSGDYLYSIDSHKYACFCILKNSNYLLVNYEHGKMKLLKNSISSRIINFIKFHNSAADIKKIQIIKNNKYGEYIISQCVSEIKICFYDLNI